MPTPLSEGVGTGQQHAQEVLARVLTARSGGVRTHKQRMSARHLLLYKAIARHWPVYEMVDFSLRCAACSSLLRSCSTSLTSRWRHGCSCSRVARSQRTPCMAPAMGLTVVCGVLRASCADYLVVYLMTLWSGPVSTGRVPSDETGAFRL